MIMVVAYMHMVNMHENGIRVIICALKIQETTYTSFICMDVIGWKCMIIMFIEILNCAKTRIIDYKNIIIGMHIVDV